MRKPFPFTLQLDDMDCGPACLRMVAKHYGRSYQNNFVGVYRIKKHFQPTGDYFKTQKAHHAKESLKKNLLFAENLFQW